MPTPASPETNQYRCSGCGRHFNSYGEMKDHQKTCLAARSAGSESSERETGKLEEGEDREWVSTP